MIAAQWTPVSALKDWVLMQDICYYLQFELKKKFGWHFRKMVALYRKFTGAIVLHCVKFQPKQTSIIEMRAKIVRQIKCCLRRVF